MSAQYGCYALPLYIFDFWSCLKLQTMNLYYETCKLECLILSVTSTRHHDILLNNTQYNHTQHKANPHNEIQHNGLICDTQHK
jgi:hypothetical protein